MVLCGNFLRDNYFKQILKEDGHNIEAINFQSNNIKFGSRDCRLFD